MKGLMALPYEVLANVASNLNFDDIVNLGKSCKFFQYLHTEESICKVIVQSKIPFANEAKGAAEGTGANSSVLRRVGKRREALATANPFVVAVVGLGDAFLYCKGVLCYTLDDRVRVLDLHNSGQYETVISIPVLLTFALTEVEHNSKGVFQVLYYAENIISCLYKTSGLDPTAWLISFNKNSQEILVTEELASVDKIFVRHNREYLYYGTHSEIGIDGYKKWVIHGYDFTNCKWFPQKMHLPDMVGSEIGSTICFEFYREHFYALSNQTSFDVEEIDWSSFYHCFRFPLNCPVNDLLERTVDDSMWRRQHQEGPIDDRWTSLRLDEDETTGELRIVESRKEWYLGSSKSQITYYTTEIIFHEIHRDEEELTLAYSQASGSISASSSLTSSGAVSSSLTATVTSAVSSSTSASTSSAISTVISNASSPDSPKAYNHDLSLLPDEPILRLLRADDNPHHIRPPPRQPQNTHPGNDGCHKPIFTLTQSKIRRYHTSASTYLDLVNDPDPMDWQGTQRLRLRAGSRKLGPPLTYKQGEKRGILRAPDADLTVALAEMYREQPIAFWPPAQDPKHPDENLDQIYRVLNPLNHLGNVHGVADERSLVYATGGHEKPQALVFVGFDPAIKLTGLKTWGGLARKGVGEGPHIDGRATGYGGGAEWEFEQRGTYMDVTEADRMVTMDRKGKGKEMCTQMMHTCSDAEAEMELGLANEKGLERHSTSWAWVERAMYADIRSGFHFGLPRRQH